MQAATTIGLDIAKSVFQVHGIDAEGEVIIRRQLKRRYVLACFQKLPPCLIGLQRAGPVQELQGRWRGVWTDAVQVPTIAAVRYRGAATA